MNAMLAVPAFVAALGPVLLTPHLAYVGPGLGLGAIAAILGIILSVFLAIFAVAWYPIKRLLGIGRKPRAQAAATPKQPEQEK